MKSRPFGFTLIEILMAVASIVLLAALVVPNMRPVLREANLQQSAEVLKVDLQWAREKAKAEKDLDPSYTVWVLFSPDGYLIDDVREPQPPYLRGRTWASGTAFESLTPGGGRTIGFNARGEVILDAWPESQEIRIKIIQKAGTGTAEVIINPLNGRVEVEYP